MTARVFIFLDSGFPEFYAEGDVEIISVRGDAAAERFYRWGPSRASTMLLDEFAAAEKRWAQEGKEPEATSKRVQPALTLLKGGHWGCGKE